MDHINQALYNLDKHLINTKETLKLEYCNAIHKTATYYNKVFSNFDNLAKEYIPNLPSNNGAHSEAFNPKMVIEYKDGKACNICRPDDWNASIGYLPNQKFIYNIALYQCWDKGIAKTIENLDIENFRKNIYYYTFWQKIAKYIPGSSIGFTINTNSDKILEIHKMHHRFKYLDNNVHKSTLHIDNYLNMYISKNSVSSNSTGIYFCFNKVPFPDFAFASNNKLSNIYVTQANNILNHMNREILFSKDTESEVLDKANSFIPDNYNEVYAYFDGIRAMANNKMADNSEQKLEQLEYENDKLRKQLAKKEDLLKKYMSSMS